MGSPSSLTGAQAAQRAPGEELDRLTRIAGRGLDLPAFVVSIVAGEEPLVRSAISQPALSEGTRRSLLYGLCLGVVDGEPLIVEDASSEAQSRELAALRAAGVEAALCFPLRADGWRVIGLLCAVSRKPRRWREVELSLFADLAQLAAIEMRREAGLEAGSGDDLHLRARRAIMSGLLSEHAPDEAMEGLLSSLCHNLGWDAGGAWLSRRERAATLDCAGVWVGDDVPQGGLTALYGAPSCDVDDDVLGQVWMRQEPIWAPDLTPLSGYDRAAIARDAGFGAGLWFPVTDAGRALGVIELLAREPHPDHGRLSLLAPSLGRQIGGLLGLAKSF
jgi:GAF domain-containing protein